jgi:hypothetical protein
MNPMEEMKKKHEAALQEQEEKNSVESTNEQASETKIREEIKAKIADYEAYISGTRKLRRKVPHGSSGRTRNESDQLIFENLYFEAFKKGTDDYEKRERAGIPQSWVSVLQQDRVFRAEIVEKSHAAERKYFAQNGKRENIIVALVVTGIIIGAAFLIRGCVSVISG